MLYDKDIREPLFEFLEETYGKIRIIEEKRIGKCRADVVMVTEEALVGIEIKSDADTYARLKGQVKSYDAFFDYNIIAAGSSHALHIKEHVPESWGIITIDELEKVPDFYMYRRMQKNPKADLRKQLSFLWRPELAHIQELNHMHRYREKSRLFVINKILETVPEAVLKRQLCQELFERDYTAIAETIAEYRAAKKRYS